MGESRRHVIEHSAHRTAESRSIRLSGLSLRWFPVFLLFLLGLPLTGCDFSVSAPQESESSTAEAKEKPEKKQAPALVEVVTPVRATIRDSLTLSGDLQAENWIDITSRVSEEVAEVAVREGDRVKKGALLIKLEDRELAFTAQEREQAHKEALERLRTSELDEIEQNQNEELRNLAFVKAEKEFKRFDQLLSTGKHRALTEEEFDAKRFAFDEARLSHESAKVAKKKAAVATRLSGIAVEQAKLAWERAKLDLARTEIRSPVDGAVAFLEVRPGEMVQSGALTCTVVNNTSLYCEVRVPQRHLSALEPGQPVKIETETFPGHGFAGRVDVIHPTIDPEQGTVKVRLAVEDPDRRLRPGIYIAAEIDLAVHQDALLVPKRARMFEGDESVIFVVRDDRAVRLAVPVGLQNAENIEVLPAANGELPLTTRDAVITRGQNHLKDGVLVEIYDGAPQPAASADGGDPVPAAVKPEEA